MEIKEKKRLRKKETSKYRKYKKNYCEICLKTKKDPCPWDDALDLHHITPISDGGLYADGFITVCKGCHKKIHKALREKKNERK